MGDRQLRGAHPSPEPLEPTTRLPISGNGAPAHRPAAPPRKCQAAFRLGLRVSSVTKPATSASCKHTEPLPRPVSSSRLLGPLSIVLPGSVPHSEAARLRTRVIRPPPALKRLPGRHDPPNPFAGPPRPASSAPLTTAHVRGLRAPHTHAGGSARAYGALPLLGALYLLLPLPEAPFPALLLVTYRKSSESRLNCHLLTEATADSPAEITPSPLSPRSSAPRVCSS